MLLLLAAPFLCLALWGCPAALVAGGAVGGYKAATDERSLGTQTDDALITSKVKTRLIADKEVHALNVDVDTLEGVVTLSGKVGSAREAARAGEIARGVKGVRFVRNQLTY